MNFSIQRERLPISKQPATRTKPPLLARRLLPSITCPSCAVASKIAMTASPVSSSLRQATHQPVPTAPRSSSRPITSLVHYLRYCASSPRQASISAACSLSPSSASPGNTNSSSSSTALAPHSGTPCAPLSKATTLYGCWVSIVRGDTYNHAYLQHTRIYLD